MLLELRVSSAAAVAMVILSAAIAAPAGVQPAPAQERGGAAGEAAPFEGRYRHGPEVAPVRIVVFTDYQCPDCDTLDQKLEPIMAMRPEVAVSVKYFPFSRDCNPHMPTNPHPNACWAARAAETAGMLRGRVGFWGMHRWLFSRRGSFTDAELHAGLAQMGYDRDEFIRTMMGPTTLEAVRADIDEGMMLGIFSTPMIFVNGREVRAWREAGVLEAAIDEAALTEPTTAAADRPAGAPEKIVADWRSARVLPVIDGSERWLGAGEDAKVSIVVWGDLLEPNTARLDAELRRLVGKGSGVRYAVRNFPVDQACNPALPRTAHPGACVAARAAEAVFAAGGAPAGHAMHRWIFENQAAVLGAARAAGADTGKILAAMEPGARAAGVQLSEALAAHGQAADALIARDIGAARRFGVASIPLVFVNNRQVQRWIHMDRSFIDRIVEAAAAGE